MSSMLSCVSPANRRTIESVSYGASTEGAYLVSETHVDLPFKLQGRQLPQGRKREHQDRVGMFMDRESVSR